LSDGPAAEIDRVRLLDLFRPRRLYLALALRPGFVVPMLVLMAAAVLYGQVALRPALPQIVPELLESSLDTESELTRAFRWMVLTLSLVLPMVFLTLTAFATWLLAKIARGGRHFFLVLALVAHASLWAALGLVAKALLVLATGDPEPSVNLALPLAHPTNAMRVVLAFTNPFLLLAMAWTARGLRAWGSGRFAAGLAGVLPWACWIVFFVLGSGGTTGRLGPTGPVSYDGWETVRRDTIVLRHPGRLPDQAERLATILDGFSKRLAEQFDLELTPLRVHVFADHAELERATGELLHVKVTGSIRGHDLLFLEMPGRSVAVPEEDGIYEAMRYTALMRLAFAEGMESCPRWFVEGLAHAAARPYSPKLEQEYRSLLRRTGVPRFETLLDPQVYATPDGPLLARSLLDHIVYHHGREALDAILRDVAQGTDFRDALFAATHLTTSALEAGWQESVREVLQEEEVHPTPELETPLTPADSIDVVPFRPRG
jgi:hypothetical protein